MSLYYEAAGVLANSDKAGGSFKSRIYNQKDLKSQPAQIVALVTEASKWSAVLKDVIETSGLLAEERKLTPILALLLTHDLLISKRGVVAPANHVLKLAIHRHRARLNAELTKARLRGGHATLQAFRDALDFDPEAPPSPPKHPRWVRINVIKTSFQKEMSTTFAEYERAENLEQVMRAPGSAKIYFHDLNIPDLIALPSKADLSRTLAYTKGRIIFQDKASCFPAYLLDPKAEDGDVIDGCAAPGNKTTHLAAIMTEHLSRKEQEDMESKVIAFERDKIRTNTLFKMVKLASADQVVTIKGGQDFLEARPTDKEFANVGALLLDPSCSGSGIVGRDDAIKMHLPVPGAKSSTSTSKSKKRKRTDKEATVPEPDTAEELQVDLDDEEPEEPEEEDQRPDRLTALSGFQLLILKHAMRFPKARKITYSTCSIYFEENEGVVFQALNSKEAKKNGWTILKREDQVRGLKKWERRGVWEDDKLDEVTLDSVTEKEEVLDACIRCEKATDEGTMGFFVAAFVRDVSAVRDSPDPSHEAITEENEDEEWGGFSDEETPDLPDTQSSDNLVVQVEKVEKAETKPKKKKRKGR